MIRTTDLQARIYELMNLLDAEGLDPAAALTVREQLEALTDLDLDEGDQRKRWERIKRQAPALWERSGAQQIVVTLISAELTRQLAV